MKNGSSSSLWRDFGSWVREHREKARWSQAGAAQRAGIDRQQWYRIESGKSGTKRDTVLQIAKAISVDPDEALKRAGFSTLDANDDGLFSGLNRLSPDMQRLARRQIRAIIESLSTEQHDTDYIDDAEE